ncbi:DeoR/GlpR family DNA-binding transcription regulator [Lactobacillus sp. PSON]|uniref:DeoR/GlpR family DNA-binding transcription regulator n=1 Tax=Lactobacillus sp. PSON TaxID=3455454 RepID=UPI0040429954
MSQEKRLIEIKKLLKKEKQLSTRNLAKHFGVSFDTARRDVIHLTSTGQALRVHGGLMVIDDSDVPDFLARTQIQSPIKIKMAKAAARFVHPGQLDFIGPSTTLRQLCTLITGKNLEIVTNSVDNALALMTAPLPTVSILGGTIQKKDRLIYSMNSLSELNKVRFDTAFIGTSKVRKDGVYTSTQVDAQMISIATSRAKQVVLIAEQYKFTNTNSSPFMSLPLDKVDVLITDIPLSKEFADNFSPHTQIISVIKEVKP